MKGATAWPEKIKIPMISRITTRGINHQALFCQAKAQTSLSKFPRCPSFLKRILQYYMFRPS